MASLLRLRDNACNVPISEKLLVRRGKFLELFLLYERKAMHEKALDLLKSHAGLAGSTLAGLERSVHYLQNLGPGHLPLIFKHAGWVLEKSVAEGLKIFTEDCEEVRGLDRDAVLSFLLKESPDSVIPYLEHVVWEWAEERRKFHDTLGEAYLGRVKKLRLDFLRSLSEGAEIPGPGNEPGELGTLRGRLLKFLTRSMHYNPEMLLVQLPQDGLFEERALVLGRLGRHDQAIAIYTNILLDYKAAERYAVTHYSPAPGDRDVYLTLVRMYARPAESGLLGLLGGRGGVTKPRPNVALALQVLRHYAGYIDTVQGCSLLPDDLRLDELWVAVEAVLQQTATRRRREQLNRSLVAASLLRAKEQKMRVEQSRLNVDYDSACKVCAKRISNSAFVRYPDGKLVHYFCFKQKSSMESLARKK